jgi:hypothetical protein
MFEETVELKALTALDVVESESVSVPDVMGLTPGCCCVL